MSQERNNPIKEEKIRKRLELLKKGLDPYPHTWSESKKRTSSVKLIEQALKIKGEEKLEGPFYIAGRLMRKRPMGKAAFFNIQDEEGELQCYIRKEDFSSHSDTHQKTIDEKEELSVWDLWKLCDIGDIVALSGQLFKTKKGEASLRIKELKVLCKTLEALPEKYHGLEDKELKYRYRHLDLIMDPESRKVFKLRSKIIQEIRFFMNEKGFMEVETPVLQTLYGGALAVPFETYFRRLNQKMYLKISPEIYLKKLIAGGFEKVFEIGKNFRNEGIDRTHNPEFTMMEYYQAYTDYKDQMDQFEELICFVTKKIKADLKFEYQEKELNLTPPWPRLSLKEAVKKYAQIDPDKLSFKELFSFVKDLEPKISLEKIALAVESKNKQEEDLKEELLVLAFELTAEKELWNPVFITDFPLSISPLTKKHRDKNQTRIVERFEPYIAGMEIGNAYTELNDPIDQRQRLTKQKKDLEGFKKEQKKEGDFNLFQPIDENFLHALEVGMPPTGGVGLGIERLVMILTNQKNLRDSILFPVLKDKT